MQFGFKLYISIKILVNSKKLISYIIILILTFSNQFIINKIHMKNKSYGDKSI